MLTRRSVNLLPRLCVPLPVPHPAEVAIIIFNRDSEDQVSMESCRPIIRELRELPQPLSMEYLTGDYETDSDSRSVDSRESEDEFGQDLHSLTKSLEDLEEDVNTPVLVQVSARSQSIVESTVSRPLVAQYTVRSETSVARLRNTVTPTKPSVTSIKSPYKSDGSMARIASAEDMRIETETVVLHGGKTPSYSTVV